MPRVTKISPRLKPKRETMTGKRAIVVSRNYNVKITLMLIFRFTAKSIMLHDNDRP